MPPPPDFDPMFGRWRVQHRRLHTRLAGADDWQTFEGTSETRPILGGFGNLEENVLHMPGGPVQAVALRNFDPATGLWAIWWLSSAAPHTLDVPVKGRFSGPIGTFEADDTLAGRPIRVRFTWDTTDRAALVWTQAFSPDAGATWEVNWTMRFTPA